jgi:hypothetical protein
MRPKFAGQRDIDDFNNRLMETFSSQMTAKNYDDVKLVFEESTNG